MTVYRITSEAAYLWSGEGARLFGGRWNSPETPAIYCATSLALCALEQLVHIRAAGFPSGYVFGRARMKNVSTERPRLKADELADLNATRRFGDEWIAEGRSAALIVPTVVLAPVVTPQDRNVVLNPLHPEFDRILLGEAQDFVWDQRLFPDTVAGF